MIKKIYLSCYFVFTFCALNSYEIRSPFTHEIVEVSELYFQAWHDTYDVIAPHLTLLRTRENCLKQWQAYYLHINDHKHFILIARDPENILGVVYAKPIAYQAAVEYPGYNFEIDKLYVAKNFKNKGIGTALLKTALAKMHAMGFNQTIVRSLTKNQAAAKFYEKSGGILIAQPTVDFNETMNVYRFITFNDRNNY